MSSSAADRLQSASDSILANFFQGMEKACLIVESAAKKNCPVDEGPLRTSITHDVSETPQEIRGRDGTNMEYGPYVHQGTGIYAVNGDGRKEPWGYTSESPKYSGFHVTVGQKPQPFLKDAVEANKDAITAALVGSQTGGVKIT